MALEVAFIGGGNMGEAMLSALLDRGLSRPGDIRVSDINVTRLQYLSAKYGVAVMSDNPAAVRRAEVVVLAVKPQVLPAVMPGLKGQLKEGQLVISIIAGARLSTLRQGLGYDKIVRVMPNTPAQIGEGMSVWSSTPETSAEQRAWAGSILSAMGQEIRVEDENYIDMATAVSGSGPAYLYLFIEALTAAAVGLGFSEELAGKLVAQTVIGAGHYWQRSMKSPAELRRAVTSPGGTTAEALKVFEEGKFNALVKQAVTAAYDKARQLGN